MTAVTDAGRLDLGAYLRRGDHIVWGQACGEPTTLVEALIAQAERIGGLSAFAATSFSGLLSAEAAAKFKLSSMGAIGALRTVAAAGRLGIVPCHVSQIGPMIGQGLIGCDVAFVQVSPPDADGNHSYGLIGDFVQAAVAKARVVIAEVNERVPFTLGDAVLPAARIDCAVHVARVPVEVPQAQIGETDQSIARIAAGYIEDGTVIQVGNLPAGQSPVAANLVMSKELRYQGSFRFTGEYAIAADEIASGKVDLRPLMTHAFAMSEANHAFEVAHDRNQSMKVHLQFD